MLDRLKQKKKYSILYLSLMLYLLLLIWVVIFKMGIPELILEAGHTVPPYSFSKNQIEYIQLSIKDKIVWAFTLNVHGTVKVIILDFVTNIATFMPLGMVLASIIKKHNVIYPVLIGFTVSLIVEIFQLCTLFGRCDFYDLVFNTVGTLFGILLYILLVKVVKKDKINLVINIFGIVVNVIMLALLIYAIISIVNAKEIISFKWYEVQKYI